MAITTSAKKANRSSERKRVFNLRRKQAIESAVKGIKKLLKEKKVEEAQKLIGAAYSAFDKAAKGHTVKKGAANRKKSRLAKLIARTKQSM